MAENIIALIGLSGVAAAAAGVWLASVLRRYRAPELERAEPLPIGRYAALKRLASDADLRFLRGLPGFQPATEKKFVRMRRRVFREYLLELAGEFRQVHKAARALVSAAPEEHAELVSLLGHQQLVFWRTMLLIEARLALSWAAVPEVDLTELLDGVAALRSSLAQAHQPGTLHAV